MKECTNRFMLRGKTAGERLRPGRGPAWTLLAALVLVFWGATSAQAQFLVRVECFDENGNCVEVLDPNPVQINVDENVQWFINPECGIRPCSGVCEIQVPPGPGFPGFFDVVQNNNFSNPTAPFNQPGIFYYTLNCSPDVIGTIIVGQVDMQLFITGPCPGTVTLEAKSCTAGAKVFFAYGFASGSTNVPGCPGVSVDIANAKVAGKKTADATGTAKMTGFAPAGVCGRTSVQAVEPSSCRKSNVANI